MTRKALVGGVMLVVAMAATVAAQHQHGDMTSAPAAPGSKRVTMDELHRGGGVPRGWKFTLPSGGDAAKGKQLFADLECYNATSSRTRDFRRAAATARRAPN